MHGWGAGPHPQQLHWRPCLDPHSPGPGDAPTAAGPRWHPPSRRLWGARSPWCLQRRQTLSGRPGSGGSLQGGRAPRGPSCPSPHSCSSSPPSHCCWKSHSCSGGTHRSPQDRRPGSQKPWGCWPDAWSQGAGPQSSGGGPDVPVGGQTEGRRGGVRQAGAEPPGEGRGWAGSPRTGLQLSDRMRSSRPTTPPGPVCPARRI